MPPTTARICPNCQAAVPAGRRQCLVCKLEVARMDAFAAAKQAAMRKGVNTTRVEGSDTPFWRRPIAAVVLVALLLGIGALVLVFSGASGPPAWTKFPPSREEVVNDFLGDIAVGDDPGYDKAYALLAPSVKHPDNRDELGEYRQLYHEMYKYLNIFSPDWVTMVKLDHDPNNPDVIEVHVGPETLHIATASQTPPDKLKKYNHHYAVTGIGEFDISMAAGMQQQEAIAGVIRGYAGNAAMRNIQSVLGASGAQHHETPFQTKLRLMPLLVDPRSVNKYEVYQTWPVRKDPAMRWELERIVGDGRYDPSIQQVAQEVLDDKVSEEELIAAHVQY